MGSNPSVNFYLYSFELDFFRNLVWLYRTNPAGSEAKLEALAAMRAYAHVLRFKFVADLGSFTHGTIRFVWYLYQDFVRHGIQVCIPLICP